ncbi:aminotransferase class I/II-fold pyridoxal phosphate-dependent enzyme [Streptomyces millisiae]|uniref:Aminotransferase class I/II-fold pyridoxal phosphate-dependent enzyme n=1 Tax=Streptomyces millisiae TaxID=3075542 RepID=A0ABU2LMJ8_9ACTN|nr:aminotransferase class I/II-fold pyridoxal phosphate-dependent enzyme [Streptomyces sp. DSM 44918]MDT0318298.1 aminotransferase class I/II-fold pyridoxal phosphate-dependent enzyme [Streptomyces sp. DSM 44918]
MVSRQAGRLVKASPPIAAAHFRAEADPYHPERNPGGYVNLGTAENRLVADLLAPRLAEAPPPDAATTRYAPLHGSARLREAIAGFLSATSRATPVDPGHLVVVAGATTALDVVATALCDPGDGIVVPAPYYGAFDVDLAGRSGARLLPAPLSPADGFALAPDAVRHAVDRARRDGVPVRALALSSPSNPLGQVYPAEVLRRLLAVAAELDLDVISDELYAHSVFGPRRFVSAADAATGSPLPPERVHVVWGFAKDFALPGFKAGVLHTTAPDVLAAARELAYFAPLSTQTQELLAWLLTDDPGWVARYLAAGRRRLGASYTAATGALEHHGVPHLPAEAGFSVWLDLRAALPAGGSGSDTGHAAEQALWRELFENRRVSMLPGGMFAAPEPGWFRMCHTTEPTTVRVAVERLGGLLAARTRRRPPTRRTR